MITRVFTILLFSTFLLGQDKGSVCPVGGEPVDSTVFIMHEGRKVFFCCEDCIPEFKTNPDEYLNGTVNNDTKAQLTENDIVFEVFGMDCPGCHGGLEKLLLRIDGVESATANYLKKQVSLTLKEGAELDETVVKKAVESANFTLGKRL